MTGRAWVAQLVERVLGKDEVTGSIPVPGSRIGEKHLSGGNSVVESLPSKQMVAGSSPVPRSIAFKGVDVWFAYAIRSEKDGWLYIGISSGVEGRLKEHNAGYNRSTKSRRPFQLIYLEPCGSRAEARAREKHLKSGIGREFLRKLQIRDAEVKGNCN